MKYDFVVEPLSQNSDGWILIGPESNSPFKAAIRNLSKTFHKSILNKSINTLFLRNKEAVK